MVLEKPASAGFLLPAIFAAAGHARLRPQKQDCFYLKVSPHVKLKFAATSH
jgi:hypothetical protein